MTTLNDLNGQFINGINVQSCVLAVGIDRKITELERNISDINTSLDKIKEAGELTRGLLHDCETSYK